MSGSLHSNEYQLFLDGLRTAREKRNVTQAELARRLGETQSFVSKSERGERRLDLLELFAWLNALEIVPPTYIGGIYTGWRKRQSA